MPGRTLILNHDDALLKLRRIAYEIVENHLEENEIYLLGIRDRGYDIANMLKEFVSEICKIKIHLIGIQIDKTNPVQCTIEGDFQAHQKVLILVDDVANSGRTALYAMRPLLAAIPAKIQLAVLVDRKHKLYPVTSDYVGVQIATNLHENIIVELDKQKRLSAFLR